LAQLDLAVEPVEAARRARLRYVAGTQPGIRRLRRGKSFRYLDAQGRVIRDAEEVQRLRRLAIPPAWTDVWICPDPQGHLLATGRDARGRKQYRYHPRWREVRDETKYDRMIAFGHALPRIRARIARDLRPAGLPRQKVLATVVRLLETTLIRVGNDEYARHNRSFGLTTLRNRHVAIRGARLRFEFSGKHGIVHEIELHDPRLARIVKQCRELPGHELFQYVDEDGMRHSVSSTEVNEYLREISGDEFTAKDFRTWAGTVLAARALHELAPFRSQKQAKRNVKQAVEAVATVLGNTQSICRKCYVHPAVLQAYLDGSPVRVAPRAARPVRGRGGALRPEEAAVLAFLKRKPEQTPKTATSWGKLRAVRSVALARTSRPSSRRPRLRSRAA
jgi:DNA topoisomerase-1